MLPERHQTYLLLLICATAILCPYVAIAADAQSHHSNTNTSSPSHNRQPAGRVFTIAFKSKIDDSIQSCLARTPKHYDKNKKWPLLVTLHGLGDGPILAPQIDNMVQIGPYGRGSLWFEGIAAGDVFECIEVARKHFSIDDDRLYLCGFSMGAIATFNLGLRFPDIWAACVPVCGQCGDIGIIENGRHLPFWINTGSKDTVLPPEHSKAAYTRASELGLSTWKYTEYPQMGHGFNIDWKKVQAWLIKQKRTKNPKQVSFTTTDLNSNRAYWVYITGIENYSQPSRVDAAIDNQTISLTTNNITNYSLKLNNALLDLARQIEIIENGVGIFKGLINDNGTFTRRPVDTAPIKRPGLCGPLWDIYSSPCILVYPTASEDTALINAARKCAESFLNPRWMPKVGFKLVADIDVTAEQIAQNNLVLFGNPQINKVLAQVSDRLPVEIKGNTIIANGKQYTGRHIGYVLIYPNPLNTEKYVAAFCGTTAEAIDCFDKIWPRFHAAPKTIDMGIFQLLPTGHSPKWQLKEVFTSNWTWQSP